MADEKNEKIIPIEQMLSDIYEKIADKTLTFGCLVEYGQCIIHYQTGEIITANEQTKRIAYEKIEGDSIVDRNGIDTHKILEIIGHPVMIGDVLDWIKNIEEGGKTPQHVYKYRKFWHSQNESDCVGIWKEKRKPIDEQSDECIKYIHSL